MLPYLNAIRARWRLIVLVTLAAVGGAVVGYALLSPGYSAQARILVSPVSEEERALLGLTLTRDANDPTRTVQTAAALVDSRRAAELAATRLADDWTGARLLDATDVNPLGESNVLAVEGKADTAELAARVANEFALAGVAVRRTALLGEVDAAIKGLRRRLREERVQAGGNRPSAGTRGADRGIDLLAERLAELRALRARGADPSLALVERASESTASRAGASFPLILVLALLAGAALGLAAAMLVELLSGRIRDEDELLKLYPLPVLVRVPRVRSRPEKGGAPMKPSSSPQVLEVFRTLGAQLERIPTGSRQRIRSRTIMVTSASADDGKTTAVANLAIALSESGHSVLAVDLAGDPQLASALALDVPLAPSHGEATEGSLADLAREAPAAPAVQVVAGPGDSSGRRSGDTVAEARESGADFILFDTDSLEYGSALQLAPHVDEVILVARVGHTERQSFELARDMLERTECRPLGLVEFSDSVVARGGGDGQGPRPREKDVSSDGRREQDPTATAGPA